METPFALCLSGLAQGGEAVGRREDGRVVFVPGGAPGDRALVAAVETKRDFVRAKLLEVLVPGPARVTPPCPEAAAGRCGGCPFMHISRSAQLAAKEDWVRRALRKSGAEVRPILDGGPALAYRTRARLTLRGGRLGFLAPRSHLPADLSTCPVLDPALDGALFVAGLALKGVLGEGGTLAGLVGRTGAVHLAVASGAGAENRQARSILLTLIEKGGCVGAVLDGERLGAAAVDIGDDEHGPLLSAADGFSQASAAGHSLLVRLVKEAAGAPSRVPRLLELYAGGGNFTRALLGLADEVVAVEGDRAAAARLSALSPMPGDGRLVPRVEAAKDAVQSLRAAGERFPIVVLDPPRAGAKEVIGDLLHLGVERMVYVSCDPMTLGRDLMELSQGGLLPRDAKPVDLTPHAAHVEVVVLLARE